ncbi:Uncharacterised protein [Klebsiella pneumoniae]|nr:Uncharacterised protein [Klebsiella pneumoniae]
MVVPPVKEILRTLGWRASASPIIDPLPGSTLSSPAGKPACSKIFASSSAMSGVASAGLRITAFPAAIAGATFCISLAIGEFHGVIAATTPNGS